MATSTVFGLALAAAILFTAKDILFKRTSQTQVSGHTTQDKGEHLTVPTLKFLICIG